MGDRYHTIQVFLSECSDEAPDDLLVRDDDDPLALMSPSFASSLFCLSAAVGVELPKSRDVPGVRGVFPEDPKDANAPEPSPKAEDAPLVGEVIADVVSGAMPLNGLLLLLNEPSPPKRFAGW